MNSSAAYDFYKTTDVCGERAAQIDRSIDQFTANGIESLIEDGISHELNLNLIDVMQYIIDFEVLTQAEKNAFIMALKALRNNHALREVMDRNIEKLSADYAEDTVKRLVA